MQQLTINIPDNKITFFKELIESLGFKVEKELEQPVLTPEQIKLVNKERKKIKDDPNHFVNWKDARKKLTSK